MSRRRLLFVCAGRYPRIDGIWAPSRSYDICVCNYAGDGAEHAARSDFHFARAGSKFQNFDHAVRTGIVDLQRYRSVMVMDDDLSLDAHELDRLFDRREELDLLIVQPAFRAIGRVSHPVTLAHPLCKLRHTTFIEVAAPVFDGDFIRDFMRDYDDRLVGWGIDLWFSAEALKQRAGRHALAVIDEIACVNPRSRGESGGREIDRLQSTEMREIVWDGVRTEREIPTVRPATTSYALQSPLRMISTRNLTLSAELLRFVIARLREKRRNRLLRSA